MFAIQMEVALTVTIILCINFLHWLIMIVNQFKKLKIDYSTI